MFCDELKIKLVAGKGGEGCVSFRREKFVAKGGPDGGDGGNGGNITFKSTPQLSTLSHLASLKTYKAKDGGNGLGQKMYGKCAENMLLEVPVGTMIFQTNPKKLLADLSEPCMEYLAAKGGKGGRGNSHFVNSINQIPRFAEKGEPGENKEITLELKLVADIGIIGLPSAGKSTLISVISNAKPKIADYPFTTLVPNLGVVNMKQFGGDNSQSFVIADIPGLIEGASEGKGLGDKFLKHVSRTKMLVHLLDFTQGDLAKNYHTINQELKNFDKTLSKKKQIVAINKIELITEEELENLIEEFKKNTKVKKIYLISCATRKGLKDLVHVCYREVQKNLQKENKKRLEKKEEKIVPIIQPHLEKNVFQIEKIINKKSHLVFRLVGKKIEQMVVMTDLGNYEGLERIYRYMEKSGIKKALEKKGAKFGDIIKVLEQNIPYRK